MEGNRMSGNGLKRGRPRQRYCRRGHDTNACGRTMSGHCIQCKTGRQDAPRSLTLDEVTRDLQEMRRRVAARRGDAIPA
jgi:hypothetical protein